MLLWCFVLFCFLVFSLGTMNCIFKYPILYSRLLTLIHIDLYLLVHIHIVSWKRDCCNTWVFPCFSDSVSQIIIDWNLALGCIWQRKLTVMITHSVLQYGISVNIQCPFGGRHHSYLYYKKIKTELSGD